MKQLMSACVLLALTSVAQAAPVHYFDEIQDSGTYLGEVTSSNAWASPPFALNSASEQVNLWGLTAEAGQTLSVAVNGLGGFIGGFSLYHGEIAETDLLYGLFDNDGDTGSANYIAGTTTYGGDTSLGDIALTNDGFYTLVVGGKGFGWEDHYEYAMDVQVSPVPETSPLLLLSTGLFGVVALRRRLRPSVVQGTKAQQDPQAEMLA